MTVKQETHNYAVRYAEKMAAENERLRKALEEISTWEWPMTAEGAAEIARKALTAAKCTDGL